VSFIGEHDIVSGELLSVVPGHIVAKVEDVLQPVIADVPGLRQLRMGLGRLWMVADQCLANQADDIGRGGVLGENGVHRRGIRERAVNDLPTDVFGRLVVVTEDALVVGVNFSNVVIIIVLVVAAGITGVTALVGKSTVIQNTTTQSGRLSVAALQLYTALSEADAVAASAFLSAGAESNDLREQYRQALTDASVALTTAASEVQTTTDAALVAEIDARLPVYTGLVESARTFNRLGQPVGATYQRQASTLMRNEMLPAADELRHNATDQLRDARDAAAAFPWVPAALGGLTLVVLIWTQLWLTRRTNRVFNVGMLGATVAVIGFTGWLVLVSIASASHTDRSHREGADPLATLAEAHIAAQQARSAEALVLIARAEDTGAQDRYAEQMALLLGEDGHLDRLRDAHGSDPALSQAIDRAAEAAAAWNSGHGEMVAMAKEGRYQEAVERAIGDADTSLARSFQTLDDALTEATDVTVERFEVATRDANLSLSGVVVGLTALCLLALFAAAIGIQMRVSEYHA
jgi:hypothetical protein